MELRSETTAERRTPIRGSKAEVARVRETLWRIIDIAELSIREIERRLASEGQGLDLNRPEENDGPNPMPYAHSPGEKSP